MVKGLVEDYSTDFLIPATRGSWWSLLCRSVWGRRRPGRRRGRGLACRWRGWGG